jgi:replicative DNA helicase
MPVDQPTPSSLETEHAILGNLLANPELLAQTENLTVDHFFDSRNKTIYAVLLAMDEEDIPIDLVSVCQTLESRRELKAVGTGYLSDLTTGVTNRKDLTHYVRILAGMKQRRDLLMLCHRAMTLAYEPSSDMRKAIESLQEQALKISIETDSKYEDIFLDVEKFCNQYHEKVEWTIDGGIEVGTNGVMFGSSGDGKSPWYAPWLSASPRESIGWTCGFLNG